MARIRVGPAGQLPPGSLVEVEEGGRNFAVCNHAGQIHAIDGLCPHAGAALGQGNFIDGVIVCPWHAWEFDCRTGENLWDGGRRQSTYPVCVIDGEIFIEVP